MSLPRDLSDLKSTIGRRFRRPGPAAVFPKDPWKLINQLGTEHTGSGTDAGATCTICTWSGPAFGGVRHTESQVCPGCNSIARDRFLFFCFIHRTPRSVGLRVLETSPRLSGEYRHAMRRWFAYTASDLDGRAHKGKIRIDLQNMDLPNSSIDVLLTPHVLEHVPNTRQALAEIHRVLAPGGRMYLQVPILQGRTAPPDEPEFHGDNTPVFWRFGPTDLIDTLRASGFSTTALCLRQFYDAVATQLSPWQQVHGEFAVDDIVRNCRVDDFRSIATAETGDRLGLHDAYQYIVFEAIKGKP